MKRHLLIFVALFTSCVGKPEPEQQKPEAEIGMTRAEVESTMGSPDNKFIWLQYYNSDGVRQGVVLEGYKYGQDSIFFNYNDTINPALDTVWLVKRKGGPN